MNWIKNPQLEPEIFINDFMGGQHGNPAYQEYLRNKFHNGYCYYFATILKTAFNRGIICWTAPFGHFVWVDSNNINNLEKANAYDIEGKYNLKDHDTFYLIPETYIKNFICNFLHTQSADKLPSATKNDLIKAIKNYCNDTNQVYDTTIKDWLED